MINWCYCVMFSISANSTTGAAERVTVPDGSYYWHDIIEKYYEFVDRLDMEKYTAAYLFQSVIVTKKLKKKILYEKLIDSSVSSV